MDYQFYRLMVRTPASDSGNLSSILGRTIRADSPSRIIRVWLHPYKNNLLRYGVTVSIEGFHPFDPGSTPGIGTLVS